MLNSAQTISIRDSYSRRFPLTLVGVAVVALVDLEVLERVVWLGLVWSGALNDIDTLV